MESGNVLPFLHEVKPVKTFPKTAAMLHDTPEQ
jgi:hypothetical protein